MSWTPPDLAVASDPAVPSDSDVDSDPDVASDPAVPSDSDVDSDPAVAPNPVPSGPNVASCPWSWCVYTELTDFMLGHMM